MTVEECEILLDALDYTMGVLKRNGEVAAKLRDGLVVARSDAVAKGLLTEADKEKCLLCNQEIHAMAIVSKCGKFHAGCAKVHAATCPICKEKR